MDDIRRMVEDGEKDARVPDGDEERFAGYGVMAAPFLSGDLLAMRRFGASSLGAGYTSVWHRAPDGRWTFWSDRPPLSACPRYFGSAIHTAVETELMVDWDSPTSFRVAIPSVNLQWSLHLRATAATRTLNAIAGLMPQRWWRKPAVLRAMEAMAGRFLRAGKLGLQGKAPNGQQFIANPTRVWIIDRTDATLDGEAFGKPGPLPIQVQLGDFWLPQRGLFAIGRAFFEPADPQRHRLVPSLSAVDKSA